MKVLFAAVHESAVVQVFGRRSSSRTMVALWPLRGFTRRPQARNENRVRRAAGIVSPLKSNQGGQTRSLTNHWESPRYSF
jgi:hypothetical protein